MDKYFFGAIVVLIFISYLNHEANINLVKREIEIKQDELIYKLNGIYGKIEDSKFYLEAIAKNTFDTGRILDKICNKRND